MNNSKKSAILLGCLGLIIGIAGSIALQSHAATVSPATNADATAPVSAGDNSDADLVAVSDMSEANSDETVKKQIKPQSHSAIGGDGNVTAINDKIITMREEANEGGASYTIDASNADVTNNGARAGLKDIKVGDKIFVQGAISGNNVTATSISLGHFGKRGS